MYHNSKHTVLFPLILALGVIAGLLLGQYFGRNSTTSQLMGMLKTMQMPSDNKLSQTISLIEHQYVDSISMDSLAENVLPTLVSELDPHSIYIPKKDLREMTESLEGEFDGIGVMFNMATDTVVVLNVIPNGPSAKAGVQAGDRIIRVNDSLIAGRKIGQDRVVKYLRGPRGSIARLDLARRGISDLVRVEVERGAVPIKSVEAAYRMKDSLGYIKLGQFARTSFVEIRQALGKLRAEGVRQLILDLRGNSGGFLDQAILIANDFLHKGQLIVYTEDRYHRQVREFANGEGVAQDMEVVVLIDEGSASSSEILAGALQDNDRGTIVGRRSFGKGLVQQQIPFADGSALRLTTARYYTPTGRSIQKPYRKGDGKTYDHELADRYANNEFFSADSIHFADSLKRVTPKGKVVYGGGGIMPDVFVPVDTTDVSRYFIEVTARNILYRYTMEYSDRHREALNRVQTIEQLQALLDSDRDLFEDFVRYAQTKGVRPVRRDIQRSRRFMEAQLRAYIGRNTQLEDNGFYVNMHPVDETVKRACEVLDKNKDND